MNDLSTPPRTALYEDLSLYIDGRYLKGEGRTEQYVFDPATDTVIGKLPHATRDDLQLALDVFGEAGRELGIIS